MSDNHASLSEMMGKLGIYTTTHALLFDAPWDLPAPDALCQIVNDAMQPQHGRMTHEVDDKGNDQFSIGPVRLTITQGPGYIPAAEFDTAYRTTKGRGGPLAERLFACTEHASLIMLAMCQFPHEIEDEEERRIAMSQWRVEIEVMLGRLTGIFAKQLGGKLWFGMAARMYNPAELFTALQEADVEPMAWTDAMVQMQMTPTDDGAVQIARTIGLANIIGHDFEVRSPGDRDSIQEVGETAMGMARYTFMAGDVLRVGHTIGTSEDPTWKMQAICAPGLTYGDDDKVMLITRPDISPRQVSTGTFSNDALQDAGQTACSVFFSGRPKVKPSELIAFWDQTYENRTGELDIRDSGDGHEFDLVLGETRGKLIIVRDTAFNPHAFPIAEAGSQVEEALQQAKGSLGIFLGLPAGGILQPSTPDQINGWRANVHAYADLAKLAFVVANAAIRKTGWIGKKAEPLTLATPQNVMISLNGLQMAKFHNAPPAVLVTSAFGSLMPHEINGKLSLMRICLSDLLGYDLLLSPPVDMPDNQIGDVLLPAIQTGIGELLWENGPLFVDGQQYAMPGSRHKVMVTRIPHVLGQMAQDGKEMLHFKML